MNPVQYAIFHNNRAVDLLGSEPKDYNDAIDHLKEALNTMKAMVRGSTTSMVDEDLLELGINDCMNKDSAAFACEQEASFMYHDAILIPVELGNEQNCTARSRLLISCMVIFNLALANHLTAEAGFSVDGSIRDTRVRALRLYELAFNLQREELAENDVLFVLAVTNNLGLLHRQLDDQIASTQCFQIVLSTLMFLADQKQVNHFLSLDGFFVNTSYLVSEMAVAPAA